MSDDENPITPLSRIRELSIYDGDERLATLKSFTYEWTGHGDGSGYEVLKSDGIEYRGVYHPGEGLCEGNPCRYCGATWVG